jgi:hypothetical protein
MKSLPFSHQINFRTERTMITNITEQLKWLELNIESAMNESFSHATSLSKNVTIPTVYSFENSSRKNMKNSAISSLSEIGNIELESFRKVDSPYAERSRPRIDNSAGTSNSAGIDHHFLFKHSLHGWLFMIFRL